MPHWLAALLAWHRANVLGNIVASVEMGAVLLLAGRPLLRRLRAHLSAELRDHVTAQVEHHVGGVHARLDDIALRLLGNDDDRE